MENPLVEALELHQRCINSGKTMDRENTAALKIALATKLTELGERELKVALEIMKKG